MEFARNDPEAEERARQYRDFDPFQAIDPALLSSAEIEDYVRVTGMVHPFYKDELKSATYGAPICGAHIMYLPDGKIDTQTLDRSSVCRLPPNSISFVEIEPTFRLPHYMALRFNLAITHVHRGLLLGTGPLIDPGFWGRILIPLHNLTDSEYVILESDNLVWIEFTKTTYGRNRRPLVDSAERVAVPTTFPERKRNKLPEWYLNKAGHGQPIRSAIPKAIIESRDAANKAASSAEQLKDRFQLATVIGTLALAGTLFAIFEQTHSLVQDAHGLQLSIRATLAPMAAEAKAASSDAKSAADRIQQLEQKLIETTAQEALRSRSINDSLARQIVELQERLRDIQTELTVLQRASTSAQKK